MILKNGGEFVGALRLQSVASNGMYTTKNPITKEQFEQDYLNVTEAINEYVKNMNDKGEFIWQL